MGRARENAGGGKTNRRQQVVDGVFTIPEVVTVVPIASPYKLVDDANGKAVHLADPKTASGTVCIYPLKKR